MTPDDDALPVVEPIDELETERLVLRRHWTDGDRTAFAALNADPEVNRYLLGPLTNDQSDAMVDRIEDGFERYGYGLWAAEVRTTGVFAGFVGLSVPRFDADFLPAVEIGWRLARSSWGSGFATEAAVAVMADGFERCGLPEIVSFTAIGNEASRRVMARLGMTQLAFFAHPSLPTDHPLVDHVVTRITRAEWEAGR